MGFRAGPGAVLKNPQSPFEGQPLRTATKDHQPPTATNRHQPPTATNRQPLFSTVSVLLCPAHILTLKHRAVPANVRSCGRYEPFSPAPASIEWHGKCGVLWPGRKPFHKTVSR